MVSRLAADARERSSRIDRSAVHRKGVDTRRPISAEVGVWVPGSDLTCHGINGSDSVSRLAADARKISSRIHRLRLPPGHKPNRWVWVPGGGFPCCGIEGSDAVSRLAPDAREVSSRVDRPSAHRQGKVLAACIWVPGGGFPCYGIEGSDVVSRLAPDALNHPPA